MKYKYLTAGHLVAVYTSLLSLTAIIIKFFPDMYISIRGVLFFDEVASNISFHNEYRIAIFLLGTLICFLFVPVVAKLGFLKTNVDRLRSISLWHVVVAALFIPISWLAYPVIALCRTCWTANDFFYLFLTIGYFMSIQIFIQALYLKINIK